MRNSRLRSPTTHWCQCALVAFAITSPVTVWAQRRATAELRGVTFSIDSGPGVPEPPEVERRFGAAPVLITQLAGNIIFAGGRGRLDVTAVAKHATLRSNGVVLSAPLAAPGDYYLFDSTGFALVRPATRTFSVFHIADDRYNTEGRRDGWPAWFPLKRSTVDTLGPGVPAVVLRQHGAYPVYWHADVAGRQLARGRFTVVDARAGDLAAVRWFAPTRALAEAMRQHGLSSGDTPTLTALGLWAEADDTLPPTAIIDVRRFIGLRRVDVEAQRLQLPNGYTEAPWPGYEKVQQVFPTSADSGARWRMSPRDRAPRGR